MSGAFPISHGFLQTIQEEDREVPSSNLFLAHVRDRKHHNDNSDTRSRISLNSSVCATLARRATSDTGATLQGGGGATHPDDDDENDEEGLLLPCSPRRRPFSLVRPPFFCPKWDRQRLLIAGGFFLLTVIVLVGIVYVALVVPGDDGPLLGSDESSSDSSDNDNFTIDNPPTGLPTPAPTQAPTPVTDMVSAEPTFRLTRGGITSSPSISGPDEVLDDEVNLVDDGPIEDLLPVVLESLAVTLEEDWNNPASAAFLARQWMLQQDLMRADVYEASDMRVLQRFALVTLAFSTGLAINEITSTDTITTTSDFLQVDTTVCEWQGVTCSDSVEKVVVYLNLTNKVPMSMPMGGTLPRELVHVTSLRELTLSDNRLQGSLPPEWFAADHWQDLYWLDITGNELTGSIPNALWEKPYLRFAYLAKNRFSGSLPERIDLVETPTGSTSYLQDVRIANNALTGPLPPWWSTLSTLHIWIAYNNQFTGRLPQSWPETLNLLDLAGNQFEGQLPDSLFQAQELEHLYLEENQLTGPLPDVHNIFFGGDPSTNNTTSLLQHVWLNDNALTGTIPAHFAEAWPNLVNLKLHNNSLTGTLAMSVTSVEDCRTLWPRLGWMQADCSTGNSAMTTQVACICCGSANGTTGWQSTCV